MPERQVSYVEARLLRTLCGNPSCTAEELFDAGVDGPVSVILADLILLERAGYSSSVSPPRGFDDPLEPRWTITPAGRAACETFYAALTRRLRAAEGATA